MKPKWIKGLLALALAATLCFAGCSVQRVEDVAGDDSSLSSQTQEETLSSQPEDTTDSQESSSQGESASPSASSGESTGSSSSTGSQEKDRYQTDPVPQGKPQPQEPQDTTVDQNKKLTCTLTIRCDNILDHLDQFNADKLSILPSDGVIYSTRQVTFYEGESVFDVLLRETQKNRIHMEYEKTPLYNSNYIEGIQNIYEFDCGNLSGWMFCVNGWYPNYGCSRYLVQDGDVIEWNYTCDLGRDLGVDWIENGQKNG